MAPPLTFKRSSGFQGDRGVENLDGEGFVSSHNPDVFHFDARAFQQPGTAKTGDAHFIRFASRDGRSPEDAALDAALFRELRIQ